MGMIYVRLHRGKEDEVLAACDEDVLGKTFRGGDMRITVSERFYNGELVSEEVFVEHMRNASIMNLVGERTIALAIENGHVLEENVIDIGGVRHAQVVKI